MKNTLLIGMAIAAVSFSSCKKDTSALSNNPEPINIRYEFMAAESADYRFSYQRDSTYIEEVAVTNNWVKTVSVPRNNSTRQAKFVVYTPESWSGTSRQSMVHLKLFVDNVQKRDTSYLLTDIDRTDGVSVTTNW